MEGFPHSPAYLRCFLSKFSSETYIRALKSINYLSQNQPRSAINAFSQLCWVIIERTESHSFHTLWARALTSQYHFYCGGFRTVYASQASLHVCQRAKPYQTSHHYKLIPQPQEGLHNCRSVVGVVKGSSDTPAGSRLTVSNESARQSLSTHPGPKEMYALAMSGMTTPATPSPTTSQELKLISVVDPQHSLPQNILWWFFCVSFNGLFPDFQWHFIDLRINALL